MVLVAAISVSKALFSVQVFLLKECYYLLAMNSSKFQKNKKISLDHWKILAALLIVFILVCDFATLFLFRKRLTVEDKIIKLSPIVTALRSA